VSVPVLGVTDIHPKIDHWGSLRLVPAVHFAAKLV
jgi:hypothetical protein